MSSDESTSTQFSTFSNKDENKEKLKHHKAEQWEINLIGNLLLDLYHRSLIGTSNDWCIRKFDMRKEYSNIITEELSKKLKDLNGTDNIGTLLHRCGFLLNTPRGSNFFKIKYTSLFEYRNRKLNQLDDFKISNDNFGLKSCNDRETDNVSMNLLHNYETDEDAEKILLQYQRTSSTRGKENYILTNMSCDICQEDFTTMDSYEEHIEKHGVQSDFEFLNSMVKLPSPFLKITCRMCKNSHHLCFEIETGSKNLIIDNIIIVQSRSLYYVRNVQVPFKCLEKNRFFVDLHLFSIGVEQPIVLIFHHEDQKEFRIIEQHHFLRSDKWPKFSSKNPFRLPNDKHFQPIFNLSNYFPPKEVQDALKDDLYYEKLIQTSYEFRDYVRNGKNLQPHNMAASIKILLQIEDMDTILQYLGLTKKSVQLRNNGDLYSFKLKTKQRIFIENILRIDDEVILTSCTDVFTKDEEILQIMMQNKTDIELMKNTFVGKIYAIDMERISFRCDKQLNVKSQYTIICRPSRLNIRYQYRSLESLPLAMDFLKKFLFPTKIIPKPLSNVSVNLYNWNINYEQLQTVRNIYEGPRNDATYIIFGPPGTGKTTTLVEGILQLLRKSDTKILVTASSDSACDEIAKRLCKYLKNLDNKRAMVRIYSHSTEVRIETMDDDLLENSNIYNGQFYPDIEILHKYRIVVCTLSVVGLLATGKFGLFENAETIFTHLIIDDVTATTEAETLIGITTVLTSKSCLIIAGDNKQLAPTLKSKRAKELGLGVSLMDRLLARDCYRIDVDTGNYDRTIQTRLLRNYRSHPAIVNLFSCLYYNHSLEAHANKDDVSLCEIWHKSRNKQYPIMFHAIYEPSKIDNHSLSLYNPAEVSVVMDYIKDLMYFGIDGKPVKESDIGIITPYKKQYKRIQEELNLRKWFGIETGSVETFQGKEKPIIIVSFVRSGTNNLSLLDNPRHLNVTISRPKSLLILIGNPKTLSLNKDFEYIIKECQRNNTFVGASAPKKDEQKPLTKNLAKSQEQLTVLNKGLAALKLDTTIMKKDTKISNKGKDQQQLRTTNNEKKTKIDERNVKNVTNIKTNNEKFKGKKDLRNVKKEEEEEESSDNDEDDNEDEDESDSDSESDDDCDKPSTSASLKNKTKSKKFSNRGKNKREFKNKSTTAKGGKIAKQSGKGKQTNLGDNKKDFKSQLEMLMGNLPEVPKKNVNFSNPQFSQMQQQDQTSNNIQQQPQMQQQNQIHNNLQQPTAFTAYNQPYLQANTVNLPFAQPVPTQFHTPTVVFTPHMIQQPQPYYSYATPVFNTIPPNMNVFPNAPINNVMTANASPSKTKTEGKNKDNPKSVKKYQNRNVTNNKNTYKGNKDSTAKPKKSSNSENPKKKSS